MMAPTAAAAAATEATDKITTADMPTSKDKDDNSLIRSEVHQHQVWLGNAFATVIQSLYHIHAHTAPLSFLQAPPTTTASDSSGLHLSIYRFVLQEQEEEEDNGSTHNTQATITTAPASLQDADGDLIVPRRCRTKRITIKLHHQRATSLNHVGLQCWRGALLLCETLLSHRKEIAGKVLCELGAGVGITSILAASLQPRRVYLTDKDDADILDLARRNVALNVDNDASTIIVQALDWSADKNSSILAAAAAAVKMEGVNQEAISILIAADVIYDDDITDAFFFTLRHMLYDKKLTAENAYCLLTLEKRTVFSLEAMATVAHGYARFRHHLGKQQESSMMPLAGTQIPIESIPLSMLEGNNGDGFSFSSYRAEVDMEVWEIRRCAPR